MVAASENVLGARALCEKRVGVNEMTSGTAPLAGTSPLMGDT